MPKQIDVDRLFETTVTVFAERGYQACTTQEIARRSGVNEATLFRRYGGKAALLNRALTHALARSSFARLTVTNDVFADLVALAGAYADSVEQYGAAILSLLTDVPRHPELRDAMEALMPNMRNAAQVIKAHQDQGRIAPGDPMNMVLTLIAPLMASGLWDRAGYAMTACAGDPNAAVTTFLNGHRGKDITEEGHA
ncbi:TetR/AcrR family transcriptional regulator [Streptomyces sp. NPDC093065]|uniref:TetR/AcrR family transcriptional regulator n=1 Tax=Streptomyces sp. NPDC093065 TaxID=3366021 RepID=UPI0038205F0A